MIVGTLKGSNSSSETRLFSHYKMYHSANISTYDCVLEADESKRNELILFLADGAKMVELTVTIRNQSEQYMDPDETTLYEHKRWVRTTGKHGLSLLMLDPNYDTQSFDLLKIGVEKMKVVLTENPPNCLYNLSVDQRMHVMREIMLNDFKSLSEHRSGSLSNRQHICNRKIREHNGVASFVYDCCMLGPDEVIICIEQMWDVWISLLQACIFFVKMMVFFYCPYLVPKMWYTTKFTGTEFVHKLPKPYYLRVIVGNESDVNSVKYKQKLNFSYTEKWPRFNKLLSTVPRNTVCILKITTARLLVAGRRILPQNYVPIGIFRSFYDNIMRCHIRKSQPLATCCATSIFGTTWQDTCRFKAATWYKVCRIFSQVLLFSAIVSPWIIRVVMYYLYEHDDAKRRNEAAAKKHLSVAYEGNTLQYLSPLHVLFIIVYVIYILDAVCFGFIGKEVRNVFKRVLRVTFIDMRDTSHVSACSWIIAVLVWPFHTFGVCGFVAILFYLPLMLPILAIYIAFHFLPTINITIRLLLNLFIIPFPGLKGIVPYKLKTIFNKFQNEMNLSSASHWHVAPAQNVEHKRKHFCMQIAMLVMCLLTFYSITVFVMEVIGFIVEVAVFTTMGAIVNAGTTLQYVTLVFLLLLYMRSCYNGVYTKYMNFHKKVLKQIIDNCDEDLDVVARKTSAEQDNTAFRVTSLSGDDELVNEQPEQNLDFNKHTPRWQLSSVLLFLDKEDAGYSPAKFFHEMNTINYAGCPGPVHRSYLQATKQFSVIVIFLLFVFMVVMAFSDVYQVSSTNQMLATLAGGFLPWMLRNVLFTPVDPLALDTARVSFKYLFFEMMDKYRQKWRVFDITADEIKMESSENPRSSLFVAPTDIEMSVTADDAQPKDPSEATSVDLLIVRNSGFKDEDPGSLSMLPV